MIFLNKDLKEIAKNRGGVGLHIHTYAAFVSFARQAITLSARRELARGLRYSFSDAQAQRCYRPAVPPASPTPDLGPTAFDAPDGEDPA